MVEVQTIHHEDKFMVSRSKHSLITLVLINLPYKIRISTPFPRKRLKEMSPILAGVFSQYEIVAMTLPRD